MSNQNMTFSFQLGSFILEYQKPNSNVLQQGYTGGAVVKNPSANAGDMGSSPGPGRSHMPQSN